CPLGFATKNRIVELQNSWSESTNLLVLHSIEVPEKMWVLFPWSELSWLRIEELKKREELGNKESFPSYSKKYKLGGRWPGRSFTKFKR
ncbi:MAG TPA: hypothetical protein VEP90_22560, partial [Methylomirabilota bacterium]|nr:hypothetical protein [Methylomirabilota bacterium]